MNVYYIGNKYQGCYYARCLMPLINNGWDGERTSFKLPKKSPQQMAREALASDVVVFHRPDDKKRLQMAKMLKQAGKMIVYDNDDTYKPNSGVPTNMKDIYGKEILEEMQSNLREFAEFADLCTTTTDFLAEEFREYNKNVEVLPNLIDPDDWDEPLKNETDKVRIGMVGSVLSNNDYDVLKDVLPKLPENVQLVIFGLPVDSEHTKLSRNIYKKEIDFWNNFDIDWQPFVRFEDYAETLNELRLDIMLIPRDESYFNKAKSNIKYLEAAMLEIPVIAQSFPDGLSPYDNDINELNGLLATDEESWEKAILSLVNDKEKRVAMGKEAKKYVLANYNIETNNKWEEIYEKYYNR